METYQAYYETSSGTRNSSPFWFSNFRAARKGIRLIAGGAGNVGESVHWVIKNAVGDTVAEGTVR